MALAWAMHEISSIGIHSFENMTDVDIECVVRLIVHRLFITLFAINAVKLF